MCEDSFYSSVYSSNYNVKRERVPSFPKLYVCDSILIAKLEDY